MPRSLDRRPVREVGRRVEGSVLVVGEVGVGCAGVEEEPLEPGLGEGPFRRPATLGDVCVVEVREGALHAPDVSEPEGRFPPGRAGASLLGRSGGRGEPLGEPGRVDEPLEGLDEAPAGPLYLHA